MSESSKITKEKKISRRKFLRSSASAGLGMALAGGALAKSALAPAVQTKKPAELTIAVIGAGVQGRVLIESCLRIPDIRIAAVCTGVENARSHVLRATDFTAPCAKLKYTSVA